MRNSEHYKDPTASIAVKEASKGQPIQYLNKPSFVSRTGRRFPYSSTKIEDMDMSELLPHIYNCAKASMNVLTCVECKPGCRLGRRAIEIMEEETSPKSTKVSKRGVAMRIKSMREYQAAIDSGDVMKYAIEHAKSSDPQKAKAAAYARVSFWRKNYGALIKENVELHTDADRNTNTTDDQPHLMQMPCLSKKVAAEREAAAKAADDSTNVAKVLSDKLSSLKASLADLQEQERRISQQIRSVEETASMLGITIA